MRLIQTARLRLRSLLRRPRVDDELSDELSYHFDRLVDDHLASGMSQEHAHQSARREMGTIEQAKESCRDARGLAWLDSLHQDVRYAVRVLTRERGFALAAVAFIGCAIGANAALFSLADGLVLRPLPVPRASQVVTLSTRAPAGSTTAYGPLSYPDYLDFVEANRSFASLAVSTGVTVGFATDRRIPPHLERGLAVSANFFETLHVTPQLGRGFHTSEGLTSGGSPVIVLAHDTWRTEWGGAPDVIGHHVFLNGVAFDVIGVAPASFTGLDLFVRPAFYIPVTMEPSVVPSADTTWLTNRERRVYTAKGRLETGISLQAARDEAERVFSALQQAHPTTNRGVGGTVRTELQSRLDEDALTPYVLSLLGGLVALVLVIACANVATLMANRARARARELAVRQAIGANRGRVVRQLMAESVLIATAGGGLGLAIATIAVRLFPLIDVAGDIPIAPVFQIDHRVLGLTTLASAVGAVLCGLLPALYAGRSDLVSVLKSGPTDGRRERLAGRSVLVTLQVAGALMLIAAALQLWNGMATALRADLGYRVDHRLTMRLDPALAGYDHARSDQFYRTLRERAGDVPGVKAVALSSWIPMADGWRTVPVAPEAFQFGPGQESARVLVNVVDDQYLRTLGVPIVAGRGIDSTDRADTPWVVVVNEVVARKYLGGQPLGKRLRLPTLGDRTAEVVGVSAAGKNISAFEPPTDLLYLPFAQHPQTRMTLTVETEGDPATTAGPLRALVRSLDAGVPVFSVQTLQAIFEQRSVRVADLVRTIIACAALLGVLLALVGLYAVVAYQAHRRTREIGLRMALGAQRHQMWALVARQAGVLGGVGVTLGLGVSLAVSPALKVFADQAAFDAIPFLVAPGALVITAIIAAAIPARRASRVDPMVALRIE